jgi:rhamnopyranosyl-N-acetylglucosaminyl-diphospho-decaprenol beta-1,3/1,4-galactofuranosyltransferase
MGLPLASPLPEPVAPSHGRRESEAPAKIAAIVVTYDRPEELRECLAALARQSRKVDRVYVIDNHAAERDGPRAPAPDLGHGLPLTCLTPHENLGGAGGFSLGIERAYADGFDWLWLMDDDAVAADTALEALLTAHERMPASDKPMLLASHVTWIDGQPHPRTGVIHKRDPDPRHAAAIKALGYESIRACTFVSALIARRAVTLYGYPVADYFILADDFEYTSRILRREQGLLVPDSVVCHTTRQDDERLALPGRFSFSARNYVWLLLYSRALSVREKFAFVIYHAVLFFGYLVRRRGGGPSPWRGIVKGVVAGLTRRPTMARPPAAEQLASAALQPSTCAQPVAD